MLVRWHFVLCSVAVVLVGCSPEPEPILNEVQLDQVIKQLQTDQVRVRARMELAERSQNTKEVRDLAEKLTDLDYSIAATIATVRATLNKEKAEPIVPRRKVLE